MPGPQLRRIYQLASLTTPTTQLTGAYIAWDVPLGPVQGGYKTMRGTAEELVEYLREKGLLSVYNDQPSMRKAVEYRTVAEKAAASPVSLPDSSTMEELKEASMCLGTEIFVVIDPDEHHEYKVVYDINGPLSVWVDGNFSQSPRGRIQAKLVPNNGVDAYTKTQTDTQLAIVATTLPITASRTADYTLALADAGCLVPVASSGAVAVTVPTNAAVPFPVGTTLYVAQDGPGRVTIAAASGVVVQTFDGYTVPGQWQDVALHKRDLNTWVLKGGGQ